MKKVKSILTLVLAAVLMLALFAGCQSAKKGDAEVSPSVEPVVERSYPYTFTDLAGTEITLDKAVETVYIVGSVQPLVSVYRYYRGSSEGLVQCPEAAQKIISSSVFADIWPDMLAVEAHGDDANAEEILALNPDIVFMTGSASGDTYDALTAAGLKVASFPTAGSGNDIDPFGTLEAWLGQMAEVFGDSASADALVDYNSGVLKNVSERLANVATEDKPSVLIIFQLSDNTLKVAGSGHYSEFWINNTGAVNAAAGIEKLQEVDIEQVMEWNPDIIYITTFSPAMPDDLYNNTIEGFDFSQIAAVQNKQVYKVPLGSYRWYAPSCECSLMLRWMAEINQPDIFKDSDIETETKDFFKQFYSFELNDEQTAALLNPSDTSLMSH